MNIHTLRSLMDRVARLERHVSKFPSRFSRGGTGGGKLRPVKITSAILTAGRFNHWTYTVVDASARTGGGAVAVAGATPFTAYNPAEIGNTGAGVEGNGVDRANLPSGWSMQPMTVGSYAFAYSVPQCNDQGEPDGTTWWLVRPHNSDDGPCS